MSHKLGIKDDIILYYIIISRGEKMEKKCTLFPLRARHDFSFRTKKNPGKFETHSILLFPDGEVLTAKLADEIKKQISAAKDEKGKIKLDIVLIDSRWKKTKGILESLPPMKRVSLEGYITGAKRKDPPPFGGLASIEALFVASLLLGKPDLTLLSNYHFRDSFLMLNEQRLSNYRV